MSVQIKALFMDQGKYTLTQPKDFFTHRVFEGGSTNRKVIIV